MEKIDRVNELPKWFSLDNYSQAKNFNSTEWLRQLEARHLLIELLKRKHVKPFDKLIDGLDSLTEQLDSLTDSMRASAQKMYAAIAPKILGSTDFDVLSRMSLVGLKGVENLDTQDLWEHALNTFDDPDEFFEAIKRRNHDYHSAPILRPDPVRLTAPHSIDREVYAAVKVSLDLPDAVLVESFKAWLAETRQAAGAARSKYHRPAYDRWASYGLLPFLDLIIWAQDSNMHIPDRVMSAAVSRYDKGESSFRKTVVPLAAGLMRDLSEFRAFAAVEAQSSANPESFEH
ncbi:DUF6387 family protein [Pseudomonas lini]|uniref:DUF6387 family protein n=1 Tax=Pseudomonas lini TaxID=163011 RepID=UPI00068317DC|nr:DUF6387 family protein [Pseudomonas lini]KNH43973.1 hypothetical protein ACS73_23230 [Pseudomonas lini]